MLSSYLLLFVSLLLVDFRSAIGLSHQKEADSGGPSASTAFFASIPADLLKLFEDAKADLNDAALLPPFQNVRPKTTPGPVSILSRKKRSFWPAATGPSSSKSPAVRSAVGLQLFLQAKILFKVLTVIFLILFFNGQ